MSCTIPAYADGTSDKTEAELHWGHEQVRLGDGARDVTDAGSAASGLGTQSRGSESRRLPLTLG